MSTLAPLEKLTFVTKPDPKAKRAATQAKKALEPVVSHLPAPLVVAVGGDGTMLLAIKQYRHRPVIFVGISAGTLGLLQTVNVANIKQLAGAIEQNAYELITSPLLAASFCIPGGNNAQSDETVEVVGYGFNDISVERANPRAARFQLKVDSSTGTFVGDGVIFATPLGSTAYSLAAGGPVIDTDTQSTFVVTPNNPHISSLYSSLQRPHVLSSKRRVRVEVDPKDALERPVQLVIDGQIILPEIDRPLNIGLSRRSVKLLQLSSDSLRNRIEDKRLGRL